MPFHDKSGNCAALRMIRRRNENFIGFWQFRTDTDPNVLYFCSYENPGEKFCP